MPSRRRSGTPCALPETASAELNRIVLDHRVGEQLAAHLLDAGARRVGVGIGQFEFDQLALADLADAVKAQRQQRIADRLALRIEHAGLEADMHARFHGRFPSCNLAVALSLKCCTSVPGWGSSNGSLALPSQICRRRDIPVPPILKNSGIGVPEHMIITTMFRNTRSNCALG